MSRLRPQTSGGEPEEKVEPTEGRFRKTWIDFVESNAQHDRFYDPLLQFVFEHIPEGLRLSRDFTVPAGIRKQWASADYRELRAALHDWRMANDEDYRVYYIANENRRQVKRNKGGWLEMAQKARNAMKALEERGCQQSVLLRLSSCIMVLEDPSAKATEKSKHMDIFSGIVAKYGEVSSTEAVEEKSHLLAGMEVDALFKLAQQEEPGAGDIDTE